MWPFTKRKQRSRAAPTPPYVDGERWAAGFGQITYISPQAAEALAAVASCVSLISETIAALPATVVLADDSRAVQPNHPLSRLVVLGCNGSESWSDLCASLISSALLRGNGLAEISTDSSGQLTGLATVPFQLTTPFVDDRGELQFDFVPMYPPRAGVRRRLLRDDVVLLKARSDSGVLGISPLQRSANAVQQALDVQRSHVQFMNNTARPSGVLVSPVKVNDPEAQRVRQDWQSQFSAEGLGKTALLSGGLDFKPIEWLSAADAQIIERLSYSVRDVSRIFNVPIFFLGDEHRSTFASASAALSYFSANTLRPWVVRLERVMQQAVLSSGYRLSIDLTALLKADPDGFAGALLKMRQGGYVTANECRAWLNLPARPDGDTITAPSVVSVSNQAKPPLDATDDGPPPKQWSNGHAKH